MVHLDMPGKSRWLGVIYDVASGAKQLELDGSSKVQRFAFDPTDRYLALELSNGAIQFWDVEGKERLFDWHAWSRGTTTTSRYLSFTAGWRLSYSPRSRSAGQGELLVVLHLHGIGERKSGRANGRGRHGHVPAKDPFLFVYQLAAGAERRVDP